MPVKTKALPFIMLVHCPEMVDACGVKGAADKTIRLSFSDQIGLCNLEISLYEDPMFYLVSQGR